MVKKRMYDRSNCPMPCKNFCYGGVLGVPEPAQGRYAAGCDGHSRGEACTVSKGVSLYFFHPDQPEWAFVPGVNNKTLAEAEERQINSVEDLVSEELVEAILPVLVESFIAAVRNKTPLPANPFSPSQFAFLSSRKSSSSNQRSRERTESRRVIKRRKSMSR